MRNQCLLGPIAAALCFSVAADSQAADSAAPTEGAWGQNARWHGRLGIGLNPVAHFEDELPRAHTGFGAALSGFAQLWERFSVGVGADWERYAFDSGNTGDPVGSAPRYTDEVWTHSRLMALVQWDVMGRRFVAPFLVAGVGYGWQDASLTVEQCTPALANGPVVGVGGGLDVALGDAVGVGLEYRANTSPAGSSNCTAVYIPEEPLGPPGFALLQRVGINVSLRL